MTSEKGTKINQLLKQWPSGTVAVLRWLEKQGVYQQLVHEYEKSAWILRVGQGAFAKSGDKIDWTGGLFALQNQLALPIYVGGVGEIAKALSGSWKTLDEKKLRRYAVKIGNSAAAKRLGYIMEALGLGDVEALRRAIPLAPGYSPLDPTMPKRGKYNRRWGLLVNAEIKE